MSAGRADAKATDSAEAIVVPYAPDRRLGSGRDARATSFVSSATRVLRLFARWRIELCGALLAAVASVALAALGPKALGGATDLVLAGAIGQQLAAAGSKQQAVEDARARGNERTATMLEGIEFVPGRGVDFAALRNALLLVVALYAGSAAAAFLQAYLLNDVVQAVVFRLRADVDAKLSRLPLGYFDRQPRGELLSRVTNDVDNLSQVVQQTSTQFLSSALTIIFVAAAMLVISTALALIALAAVAVAMAAAALLMARLRHLFAAQWRCNGALSARVEEAFTGHAIVKVFGWRQELQRAFETDNENLCETTLRAQFVAGLLLPLVLLIGNLNYVVIAVVGGLRFASGSMSLGDVQAFIQYSRQFTMPVTQVASVAGLLQSGVASAERIFELLDACEEAPEVLSTRLKDAPRGRVTFDNVSFGYTAGRPVIAGLSLVVEPGQTVAIVGPTGAGKTTLVNLLMRFYELDSGRITLDGIDIASVARDDLRSRIGMVLQETWLFRGTIRDNIAYGRPSATEAEIVEAARTTFVDRFVRNLPAGYDTIVEDDGANVSAGERQLITIARAFLAQPALLILDEATSSVDTRTELLLQHAMTALRAERTCFVIAHRLSTIRDADVILVMENGRIVERGTPAELGARPGPYSRLYLSQFAGTGVPPSERRGAAS